MLDFLYLSCLRSRTWYRRGDLCETLVRNRSMLLSYSTDWCINERKRNIQFMWFVNHVIWRVIRHSIWYGRFCILFIVSKTHKKPSLNQQEQTRNGIIYLSKFAFPYYVCSFIIDTIYNRYIVHSKTSIKNVFLSSYCYMHTKPSILLFSPIFLPSCLLIHL